MSQQKGRWYLLIGILLFLLLAVAHFRYGACRARTHRISLKGTASGGELVMALGGGGNPEWISIKTNTGEPAQVVMERLARAINEHDPFHWGGPGTIRHDSWGRIIPDGNWVQVVDGSIGPFGGGIIGEEVYAGTETGLGIPPPPKSLSCAYQQDTYIVLNWENPPGGYDHILVTADGMPRGAGPNSGNLTTYKIPAYTLYPWEPGADTASRLHHGAGFCVIGIRAGISSNAAGITFKDNGQEELIGYPFTAGVAPNWTEWLVGEPHTSILEQKIKAQKTIGIWPEIKIVDDGKTIVHRDLKWIETAADKPFIQIIKTTSPEAVAGVYRKFLGLTPGHTYRLSARLFAMDMPKAEGDWSFSLHALPTEQSKSTLTAQQMAGQAALPDGKAGPETDRIALYAPGVSPVKAEQPTIRPKRRPASAPADEPVADLVTGDITLPAGADTITAWVRHQAAHSTGVGLDWIRLEDVTGK